MFALLYFVTRADTSVRPYGIINIITHIAPDTMKMIRHDNHIHTFDIGKMFGTLIIPFFHHSPRSVQMHDATIDVTKQRTTFMYTNRDKIETFARIIIFEQTDGTTMVYVGIVGHLYHLFCKNTINEYQER